MKRRGFLQGLSGAVGLVSVPPSFGAEPIKAEGGSYVDYFPPFRKEGALGFRGISADLSEVALEDALCIMARDVSPKRHHGALYVVLVHKDARDQHGKAAGAGTANLRKHFPNNIPRFGLRVEPSFTNPWEWGIVSSDGRCFHCDGAVFVVIKNHVPGVA